MITAGTWSVRKPYGHSKKPVVCAPGVRSICAVGKLQDAYLISAAKEMQLITLLVANLPIHNSDLNDDVPIFGIDGHYITVGDVRAARRALNKADGGET